MNALQAASLYAGLNIIILLVLTWGVIRQRQANKVSLGDGGQEPLTLAIRAHANAAETIPAALVGLMAMAFAGAPAWAIHAGGALLTAGRAAHGWGLSRSGGSSPGRMFGMMATLTAFVWIAGGALLAAF